MASSSRGNAAGSSANQGGNSGDGEPIWDDDNMQFLLHEEPAVANDERRPETRKSDGECEMFISFRKGIYYDHDTLEGEFRYKPYTQALVYDIVLVLRCNFRYTDDGGIRHSTNMYECRHQIYGDNENVCNGVSLERDEVHEYPFAFDIPGDHLPSVKIPHHFTWAYPDEVYWEVRAYVLSAKKKTVSLRFRKAVLYNVDRALKPVSMKQQTSLFHPQHNLFLQASLEKNVYQRGEPLRVNVQIKNWSDKTVKAIKLSTKQMMTVAAPYKHTYVRKHHVDVTEHRQGCPIRKNESFNHTFKILPKCHDHGKKVLACTSSLPGAGEDAGDAHPLASTCKRTGREGIDVSYYINVHCCVNLAQDLIVTLNFIVSDPYPKEECEAPQEETSYLPAPEDEPPNYARIGTTRNVEQRWFGNTPPPAYNAQKLAEPSGATPPPSYRRAHEFSPATPSHLRAQSGSSTSNPVEPGGPSSSLIGRFATLGLGPSAAFQRQQLDALERTEEEPSNESGGLTIEGRRRRRDCEDGL
eukprot:Nk52_evm7s238 gene=Nk52_evmTU7s238